nr:ORFV [Citrus yellow mosaic virus]
MKAIQTVTLSSAFQKEKKLELLMNNVLYSKKNAMEHIGLVKEVDTRISCRFPKRSTTVNMNGKRINPLMIQHMLDATLAREKPPKELAYFASYAT